MKPNVLPSAVGVCLAACAQLFAQVSEPPPDAPPAPQVLVIVREQIKEGRDAAHVKAEEAWPRLYQKGNIHVHYVGMTTESGPAEAWFLEPYDSFAAVEKARMESDHSPVAGELETANAVDGELRTGSRTLLAVFRGDLSFHPAEAMSSMPKSRHMGVTLLHLKYGQEAELPQLARLMIDGYEKSNSVQPVLAYQVVSGGPSGTYLLFSPMDSLARMDGAAARGAAARQAMGDRNQKHFDTLAPEIVQSSESLLFAFEPRMSYVSKEFAAEDPEFWNPKPKAPSRLTAKPRATP